MNRLFLATLTLAFTLCGPGCASDDPVAGPGRGAARFTTWGEPYIEDQIGPDPSGEAGFVDGWTVKYSKFLLSLQALTIADRDGRLAARLEVPRWVDQRVAGKKLLIEFADLPARAWPSVGYQIAPATADDVIVAGDAADQAAMVAAGHSLRVVGTASKGALTKRFDWAFTGTTEYADCRADEDGKLTDGIVITAGGTDASELTIHGDHFFYDRLQASPDPITTTRLRFDAIAAADTDDDGDVTLAELDATALDVTLYDPSGLPARNLGEFVRELRRTVGHFRGEGECTVRAR